MRAKSSALFIGLIFIVVGVLGFIDNPIIGESDKATFHADTMHNWVHIGSGILFLLVALAAPGAAAAFMILFGLVYLVIGILGYTAMGDADMGKVLGILHVNKADNYLHMGLGLFILILGLASRRRRVVA